MSSKTAKDGQEQWAVSSEQWAEKDSGQWTVEVDLHCPLPTAHCPLPEGPATLS